MYSQMDRGLFQALSHASDYVYLFVNDMQTNLSRWSDNAVWYFDMPGGYESHTLEVWMEKIHPDDRHAYLEDVEAVFDRRKAKHQVQYRAKNRYGDYVWLECTGNVVNDEAGEPAIFAGMITRLDNQTKYDPLTKLLSYHQFYQEGEISKQSIVLLFGMDNFRRVIQNYGYSAGNDILRCMAEVLKSQELSKQIYRMNGDEFLLILPEATKEEAVPIFQKILDDFQQQIRTLGFAGMIRFSAACNLIEPRCDKETVLKQLEHSMELAKQQGGGDLVFFSDDIEQTHRRIYEIGKELDAAIVQDFKGFELYYQPIKDNNGCIHTVESLLRFHSEKLGWISPVEFIPILESTRKIRTVGTWVMKQAVRQCKIWNQTYKDITVGFNVSYLQMYSEDLICDLINEIEAQGVRPDQIVVELTESCKVMHPESLKQMFQKLLDYGIKVALDDFGMEFSSLTLLRDLPVTTVKVDHSFVRTITGNTSHDDQVNLSIIAGIITMCKAINIHVVVEGIETRQIAEIISDMDVDYLQGYYYSRPVPPDEVEKLFRE